MDFGSVTIPPSPLPPDIGDDALMEFHLAASGSVASTYDVDFLLLVPKDGGFAREYDATGALVNAEGLIFSSIDTPGGYYGAADLTALLYLMVPIPNIPIYLATNNNLVVFAYTKENATTSDTVRDGFAVYERHQPRYLLL